MTTISTRPAAPSPLLRTAAFVSSARGPVEVTLELHGILCALTAVQLRDEVSQLIDEGIDDIVVDLADVQLCTSDGVDVFVDADDALALRQRGSVQLHSDTGITRRVLDIIEGADPSFHLVRVPASGTAVSSG